MVMMKLGMETNSDAEKMKQRSKTESCFMAASTPRGMPSSTAMASAIRPSLQEMGKRSLMMLETGSPDLMTME